MNYGCSVMPNIQPCLSIVKQTMMWRPEHGLHVSQENKTKQNGTKQNKTELCIYSLGHAEYVSADLRQRS